MTRTIKPTRVTKHARIPDQPHAGSTLGASLDALYQEDHGGRLDLVVDYQAFLLTAAPEIFEHGGSLWERVVGQRIPRRMRFRGVSWIRREGAFEKLNGLPPEHGARSLRAVLSWYPAEQAGLFSLFLHGSPEPARLMLISQSSRPEKRPGVVLPVGHPVEELRDWSPAPLFQPGLVPHTPKLHRLYGGDPVRVRLGRRVLARRLFVGDMEIQPNQRPSVDAVLNAGETPSRWAQTAGLHPNDRWVVHGEGESGMTVAELRQEAGWVIERLRAGQRVLIHCVAGLNRSTSIACAALILLEGLTAEAALARVRERHAWARPDDHHWLALKWLAKVEAG